MRRAPARTPVELTRRGWALLGAGFGLLVAGRLLGTVELVVLGTVTLALLAAAATWVRSRHGALGVARVVHPARLHVGNDARVDLDLAAHAGTPQLALTDEFDNGARAARFLVPGLAPGQRARAAYRLPTERRGRFVVGPALVGVLDPFGLARRTFEAGGVDEVTVCPRLHVLAAPFGAPSAHPSPSRLVAPFHAPSPHGEELLTLREYQVGDDLRRIHWRSTARLDELVVRQDETQWRPRTTVLLDVRAHRHDAASFETAVEAAASVVARLARDAEPFEMLTSRGRVLGAAYGRRHGPAVLGRVLDELAVVTPDGGAGGPGLPGTRGAGLLVFVTGAAEGGDVEALHRLGRPGAPTVLVATRGPVTARSTASLTVVDGAAVGFAQAWDEAMLRRSRRTRA